MTSADAKSLELNALQDALQAAGAPQRDQAHWHYIEVLGARARTQTGRAQVLLQEKLTVLLKQLEGQLHAPPKAAQTEPQGSEAEPSPLAVLLRDMAQHAAAAPTVPTTAATRSPTTAPTALSSKPTAWRAESPKVQQFKKQLSKISVQKQVKQAMAMAPQNAGPINSHMLVLRSLGLMQEASPDYLNRFMTYVDTLLCLEDAGKTSVQPKKTPSAAKPKK